MSQAGRPVAAANHQSGKNPRKDLQPTTPRKAGATGWRVRVRWALSQAAKAQSPKARRS